MCSFCIIVIIMRTMLIFIIIIIIIITDIVNFMAITTIVIPYLFFSVSEDQTDDPQKVCW